MMNAPGTFQALMNGLFGQQIFIVYLDDILVFSNTKEEHEAHLRQVIVILRNNELYVHSKKSEFYRQEHYLGHIIRTGCHI